MWEGKWTDELSQLYDQYKEMIPNSYPDEYEEILYRAMTYEEFVEYIRECLRTGKEIPDVVE